jgi:hypothetical protein
MTDQTTKRYGPTPERLLEIAQENLVSMTEERDACLAKLQRARSPHNRDMWRGRAGWAQKMVDRYQDDIARLSDGQPIRQVTRLITGADVPGRLDHLC